MYYRLVFMVLWIMLFFVLGAQALPHGRVSDGWSCFSNLSKCAQVREFMALHPGQPVPDGRQGD